MGYDDLPELIENNDQTETFDVSLACKQFPSIVVGGSPPVALYDGTTEYCDTRGLLATAEYEDILSDSMGAAQTQNRLHEIWDAQGLTLSNIGTSLSTEAYSHAPHLSSEPPTLVGEKLKQADTLEESSLLESQVDATYVELFLDKAISSIQGLKKRHCRQLEDTGFHTVCSPSNYMEGIFFFCYHLKKA